MHTSPLPFLQMGWEYEATKHALKAIQTGEAPERVAVIQTPGNEPFVYATRVTMIKTVSNKFAYLKELPQPALEAIRAGRAVLMIDSSDEGAAGITKYLNQLREVLQEMEIPPRKVIYVSQNRLFPTQVATWQEQEGVASFIHCGYYHRYLRSLINFVSQKVKPSGEWDHRRQTTIASLERGEIRERSFVCLNYTPRFHRIATVLFLLKRGLLDKGFVSFAGLQNRRLDYRVRVHTEMEAIPFPEIRSLKEWLPQLTELGTLRLDADLHSGPVPSTDIGQFWYYERSYFSLVTESGIQATLYRRFTEKVFKPILGLQPFLILGLSHTLEAMQELGFKTFGNWIDPRYDQIEDDLERLTVLLAEFERLCRLPRTELDRLYREMFPDILHNYDFFGNQLTEVFVRKIENPLLDQLREIATAPL